MATQATGIRVQFYGQYVDRRGDLLTWSDYCETPAEAMWKLTRFAGNLSAHHEVDPEWTQVLFDDGTIFSRAEYEQRMGSAQSNPPAGETALAVIPSLAAE